jgi:hypothetical protein
MMIPLRIAAWCAPAVLFRIPYSAVEFYKRFLRGIGAAAKAAVGSLLRGNFFRKKIVKKIDKLPIMS